MNARMAAPMTPQRRLTVSRHLLSYRAVLGTRIRLALIPQDLALNTEISQPLPPTSDPRFCTVWDHHPAPRAMAPVRLQRRLAGRAGFRDRCRQPVGTH